MHFIFRYKQIILLAFIVCVAVFFRFYQLGSNPPFLNWDEAAWGYNAYSIGIDGRDEFGRFLPHDYLESFGDYKPPVYAYLDVAPIKMFGLNAFATRFPSALFGVLTVLMTYLLVKRIFPVSKEKECYALVSAFILAISPWHIMLSRAAFEANIATFLLVSGIWLFLAGMQEKKWCLVAAVIPLALSFYTFNTPRIVTPLVVVVFSLFFWKKLLQRKKYVVTALILAILCLLPTVKFLFSSQAKVRFEEVNIFTDASVVIHSNQEVKNDKNAKFSMLLHNRRLAFSVDFLKHYFDNLSPSFLFISGDGNPKFSIQDVGQMYLWDIPFFFIGILLLFRKKEGYWWIIPLWLLLGIIPAATARETPHALRTEITLPMFQIFVAYGVVNAFIFLRERVKNASIQKSIIAFVVLFLAAQVFYFQYEYHTYYPYRFSGDWNYTYKDSIAYVTKVQSLYNKVVVSDVLGRPYIYYLFYMHVDPVYFRQNSVVTRDVFGFVDVHSFGKYIFTNAPASIKGKQYIYIDSVATTPKHVHILKTFTNLDGTPVLDAYTL